jgi:ankyrin repeat protein
MHCTKNSIIIMPRTELTKIKEVIEAAEAGNLNKIRDMASSGIEVNAVWMGEGEFQTAYEAAYVLGHAGIVRYLLDNYYYSEIDKEGALQSSVYNGRVNVIKLLLEEYGVYSSKAIHCAIENDQLATMKYMLELDPRYLYAENDSGRVPLQTAVSAGKLLAARELLENHKVDLHKIGSDTNTTWSLAITKNKDVSMLQLLLQHGEDINQMLHTWSQERAIHYVLDTSKTLETAEFLASSGAEMQFYDALGNNLLHFLLRPKIQIDTPDGFMDKVQFLVEYGVDPREENPNGQVAKSLLTPRSKITPEQFDISVERGLATIQENKRIIALTLEHAANVADLPELPRVLPLLIADYVGGYGRAFATHHLPDSIAAIDDGKEEASVSGSSSDSPDSPPDGGRIKASSSSSADQPSDKEQSTEVEPSAEKPANYDEKAVEESGEALLMKLFSWIEDLPEELKQQILFSSSTQLLLEILETITQPNKFIADMLSTSAIEESFKIHYGQDDLWQTHTQGEAQVSQYDSLISLNKEIVTITSDGILMDYLPKHDINFGPSYVLGDLSGL